MEEEGGGGGGRGRRRREGEDVAVATLMTMQGAVGGQARVSPLLPPPKQTVQQLPPSSSTRYTPLLSGHLKVVTTRPDTAKKVGLSEPSSSSLPLSIMRMGSGRETSRFGAQYQGGISRVLPGLDAPITSRAERDLFAELLPQYQSSGRRGVDYRGMLASWNIRFLSQTMGGEAGKPLAAGSEEAATMIWSKKIKHLKEFYASLDSATRVKENALFAFATKAAPLSPSATTPNDQGTILSFYPKSGSLSGMFWI